MRGWGSPPWAIDPLRPCYNQGVEPARPLEEAARMSAPRQEPPRPVALSKEGDDRLLIQWSDGHRSVYAWQHLRKNCPCAGCREERVQPPDPFRILKPAELAPLRPLSLAPAGY